MKISRVRNDEIVYRAETWAEILSDEEPELGYGTYRQEWLLQFFINAFPANRKWFSEQEIIEALRDDGYYPDCELCGMDGEEYVFRTGYIMSYESVGNNYIFICNYCKQRKMIRRARTISGINKRELPKRVWQEFFKYAVLEKLIRQATEGK